MKSAGVTHCPSVWMYSSWFPTFLFICFFQSDSFKMTEDKIYRVKCIIPFFLFPLVATSVGIVKMVMVLYGGLDVLEDMNFSIFSVSTCCNISGNCENGHGSVRWT